MTGSNNLSINDAVRSRGERTPNKDAGVRGAFIGLAHETNRAAGTRAVLEALAYAFRDTQAAMAATGTQLDSLIAVGGGAASSHWLQTIATVLGLPISVPAQGDYGAAFGAARLGVMAAGDGGPEIATAPEIAHTYDPDTRHRAAFDDAYARYRATYQALKDIS